MHPTHYRRLRRALKLSQARLARALGLHEMTISKRERGEHPISREAEYALRYLETKGVDSGKSKH